MPEAVLLKDVEQLGASGTVVDVSKGYLRNYLIPRKLAVPATAALIAAAARRREAAEKDEEEASERAKETAALLGRTVLTIAAQAGTDGRLFGSVGAQDIVDAVREARSVTLDRRGVRLPEPIKSVGTYMVEVELAGGLTAPVKTMVVAKK